MSEDVRGGEVHLVGETGREAGVSETWMGGKRRSQISHVPQEPERRRADAQPLSLLSTLTTPCPSQITWPEIRMYNDEDEDEDDEERVKDARRRSLVPSHANPLPPLMDLVLSPLRSTTFRPRPHSSALLCSIAHTRRSHVYTPTHHHWTAAYHTRRQHGCNPARNHQGQFT